MQSILQIFKKLCKKFDNSSKDEAAVQTEYKKEDIIIFSVNIDEEYNRHLSIYIPDYIDSENIIPLARTYVDTFVEMGSGTMVQKLLLSLEKEIDQEDPMQLLLLDNIISLFVEYSQIKSDPTEPMISPLSVFNK